MSTKAVGIVAVLAVAIVAACGGGGGGGPLSKSDYEAKLKAEGSQLKTAFSAVQLQNTSNPNELATKLTNLQQELDQSADDLAKLKPPKDAAADNDKIVETLRKFSDKFGELKRAAKDKDQARINSIGTEIDKIGSEGDEATADLKSKGYEVGQLGQ